MDSTYIYCFKFIIQLKKLKKFLYPHGPKNLIIVIQKNAYGIFSRTSRIIIFNKKCF
nr:MAG TPA: hypothetical protein [Caudoviricetes sp.]